MDVVAKETGKRGALLVGVDECETLTPLEYASSDARRLRDALVEIGFPSESIWTFVGDGRIRERPSRDQILKALDETLEASGPDSTVLIALSGHGFETEDGDAAFCPEDVDAKQIDGKIVVSSETAILIEDVAERLKADDARFKMLIVDACREPASTEKSAAKRARPFSPIPDANGVAFLQSCESREFSWEHPELEGGVFTAFFAEGLRGAADADGDGGVSFLDVCNYATSQTQRFVREKRDAKQTPFYRFSGVVDFWLKPPTRTPDGGGNATSSVSTSATLFTEAFQAFSAKDYASARTKCEAYLAASRTEAEKASARNLLEMIEQAENPQSLGDDWSAPHEAGVRKTLEINGIDYAFRYCPAGSFLMGSPESEPKRFSNETLHRVILDGFWLLETEVTQAMWKAVMRNNPSAFSSGGMYSTDVHGLDASNFPVERISWEECQEFIKKLNSSGIAPVGFKFCLPSEAEWEYACRAGTTTPFSWGTTLNGDKANCDGNYPYGTLTKGKFLERATKVGSYAANPWGLYDMHGNVYEWCADFYDSDYYENTNNARNPINTTKGASRVLRGGSWNNGSKDCRSANRYYLNQTGRNRLYGFRLALSRVGNEREL